MGVILRGYYDASRSPSRGTRGELITLAGYAATLKVWSEFEAEWCAVLRDDRQRPACSRLHMAYANDLRGEFNPSCGWTAEKVRSLIVDLLNRCFSPRGLFCSLPEALVGASCVVDLDAYQRVCQLYPHFRAKRPEALCVDHVIGVALSQLLPAETRSTYGEMLERGDRLDVIFDQNEPYRHHIQRVWEVRRNKGLPHPVQLIRSIEADDSLSSVPLQAADFLAWHANRAAAADSSEKAIPAKLMATFASRYAPRHFDCPELLKTAVGWREQGGYNAVAADVAS